MKHTLAQLKIIILGLLLAFGVSFLYASTWRAPDQSPPLQQNFPGPLHEGSVSQTKKGNLFLMSGIPAPAVLTADAATILGTLFVSNTAPVGLPASVGLWVNSTARANDFCLNSNSLTCLSTVGGGAPGGVNGNLQYKNGAAFAGDTQLSWDSSALKRLTLGASGAPTANNLDIFGQIKIRGGSPTGLPAVGRVLTSVDAAGLAEWRSPAGGVSQVTAALGSSLTVSPTTGAVVISGGGFSNYRVFNSSGTWTAPVGVSKIMVEVWGGGSGGGRTTVAPSPYNHSGSGGGYARAIYSNVGISGTNYTVTVGGGGAGTNTVDTASGGQSSFSAGTGVSISATGGVGRTGGSPPVGGSGNTPTGAYLDGNSILTQQGERGGNGRGGQGAYGGGGGGWNGWEDSTMPATPSEDIACSVGLVPGGGGGAREIESTTVRFPAPNFSGCAGGAGRVVVWW